MRICISLIAVTIMLISQAFAQQKPITVIVRDARQKDGDGFVQVRAVEFSQAPWKKVKAVYRVINAQGLNSSQIEQLRGNLSGKPLAYEVAFKQGKRYVSTDVVVLKSSPLTIRLDDCVVTGRLSIVPKAIVVIDIEGNAWVVYVNTMPEERHGNPKKGEYGLSYEKFPGWGTKILTTMSNK